MQLSTLFRAFLTSDLLLTAASIFTSFLVADAGQAEASESLAYTIVPVAVLVAWIAALAGLWRFHDWARYLYVGLAVVGIAGTLLMESDQSTGVKDALNSLCWLVTGAVIALAFWSPLASTFRGGERAS